MIEMNIIKFSHHYNKLPPDLRNAELIEVLEVELSLLHDRFLVYDATTRDGDRYPLPKRGKYLMLIFRYEYEGQEYIFTTLRRHTYIKMGYYIGEIGYLFHIEYTEDD